MKNKFIYDPNYLIPANENEYLSDVDDPWALYVKEEEDADAGADTDADTDADFDFDFGDDADAGAADDPGFDFGDDADDTEEEVGDESDEDEEEETAEPAEVTFNDPISAEIHNTVIAPIAAEAEESMTGHLVESSNSLYNILFEDKQATINIQTYADGIARYIRNYTNLLDIPQLLYSSAREYLVVHWGEEWAKEYDAAIDAMNLDVAINNGSKGKSSGKRVGSMDNPKTGTPSTINKGHNSLTGGLAVGAGGTETA